MIFRALTTSPHIFVSLRINSSSSPAVLPTATADRAARRSLISGFDATERQASVNVATTSFGVPAGDQTPYQASMT